MGLNIEKLKGNAKKARDIIIQKNLKLNDFNNQIAFIRKVINNIFNYKSDEERVKQLNNAKSLTVSIVSRLTMDLTVGSLYSTILLQADGIDAILDTLKGKNNTKKIQKHIKEIKDQLNMEELILKNAFP